MSGGRQMAGAARRWLKLHNLMLHCRPVAVATASTVASAAPTEDLLDEFTARLVQEKTRKWNKQIAPVREHDPISPDYVFNDLIHQENTLYKTENKASASLENETAELNISVALLKNKHEVVEDLLLNNQISDDTLTKLFITYSDNGNVERVVFLQNYCKERHTQLFSQHGEFVHFLAKARCLRGNSEDGLSILSEAYKINVHLRNEYRIVLRDLIKDSVSNRSMASLVVFRKYVVSWSELWNEHYPLVWFWYACWSSTWFCDQKVADELMDTHKSLRDILSDRASSLCVSALRYRSDEDAVMRMLQLLLKYEMTQTYTTILQILFDFKLKNQDKRGCSEILKNCKVLGISLSSSLRGRYIHMIINGEPAVQPLRINKFKLKF